MVCLYSTTASGEANCFLLSMELGQIVLLSAADILYRQHPSVDILSTVFLVYCYLPRKWISSERCCYKNNSKMLLLKQIL